jgi:predicted RNase H-like HicB family nuclease
MITTYIDGAMKRAKYKILSDDQTYFGHIPSLDGVWANAATLEECRQELQEVLEDWLLFRISRNMPMPELDGISLSVRSVA